LLLTIKIGPIESNNLPVNALGIFDNPAFGTTTANFATQLVLISKSNNRKESGNRKCRFNDSLFQYLKSTDAMGMQNWIQFMDHQMLKLC
jgi:hypothetical protein